MALFKPSTSMIQSWLDYSSLDAIPPLDSCYNSVTTDNRISYQRVNLNCSQVCDKTSSLIDTIFSSPVPDLSTGRKNPNLATCGIRFSTVAWCSLGNMVGSIQIDSAASGLPSVSGCNVSSDAFELALRSANAVSAVLEETFRLSVNSYTQNSVEIPDSCTSSSLFPLDLLYSLEGGHNKRDVARLGVFFRSGFGNRSEYMEAKSIDREMSDGSVFPSYIESRSGRHRSEVLFDRMFV